MRFCLVLLVLLAAAGCAAPVPPQPPGAVALRAPDPLPSPKVAAENFVQVIQRVEPVAEAVCTTRTLGLPCDYKIVVDSRPGQAPNAYQTVTDDGRPLIVFTIALVAEARNQDELAFILGHEAAHHILGHLGRMEVNAARGAALAGALAAAQGADADAVREAEGIGAEIGARRYSREFELEADALGTEIALRAGYDPALGAAYFTRIPDPGNVFLGSHPPNAARVAVVETTLARLQ